MIRGKQLEPGTNEPICAISEIKAVCRKMADLPDIFGPVINICCNSLSRYRSFRDVLIPMLKILFYDRMAALFDIDGISMVKIGFAVFIG